MAAFYQSDWAKGTKQTYRPQTAGAVHSQKFSYDLSKQALVVGDVIEIGCLPAYAQFVGIMYMPGLITATSTLDIGVLPGEYGNQYMDDGLSVRSPDQSIFAAQAANVAAQSLKWTWFAIEPTDRDRGIGIKVNGAIPAAAGSSLNLLVSFTQ